MKNSKLLTSLAVLALFIQGCAHKSVEKNLDTKMTQESEVKSRADLGTEATQLIESSTTLTAEQKTKLLALRDSMREQNDVLISESLKLRSVLIKDLIANYDEKEVSLIKKKIKTIENKRVAVLFDAIERANKILGRQAASHQSVMREFSDFHGIR